MIDNVHYVLNLYHLHPTVITNQLVRVTMLVKRCYVRISVVQLKNVVTVDFIEVDNTNHRV